MPLVEAAANWVSSRVIRTAVANRRRRARFASGRGCRLAPAHATSNGPSPAGRRRLLLAWRRASGLAETPSHAAPWIEPSGGTREQRLHPVDPQL